MYNGLLRDTEELAKSQQVNELDAFASLYYTKFAFCIIRCPSQDSWADFSADVFLSIILCYWYAGEGVRVAPVPVHNEALSRLRLADVFRIYFVPELFLHFGRAPGLHAVIYRLYLYVPCFY